MTKARNIADIGSNDVLDTDAVGVTVLGDLTVADSYPDFKIQDTDGSDQFILMQQVGGASMVKFQSGTNDGELYFTGGRTGVNKMKIATNGDIIMYKDDGTTTGFFYDASAGKIQVTGGANILSDHSTVVTDATTMLANTTFSINGNTGQGSDIMRMGPMSSVGAYFIDVSNSSGSAAYPLLLNPISGGNVGIATNNPTAKLQVEGTLSVRSSSSQSFNDSSNANNLTMTDSKAHFNFDGADKDFQVSSDNLSRALFVHGSDGNVGIGVPWNPEYQLDVYKATGNLAKITSTDDNNGATNPLSINYNSSLRVDNAWSGAGPSAHGTKVAKIQLGTVTTNGYGAYGAIIVDSHATSYDTAEMSFATGSNSSGLMTERMRIDKSGRVTMPYQPAFLAHGSNGTYQSISALGAGSYIAFANAVTNIGNCFNSSNYRFSAPVAGMYHFDVALYTRTGTASQDIYTRWKVNNSSNKGYTYWYNTTGGEVHHTITDSINIYLNAGDDIGVTVNGNASSLIYLGFEESKFSGYLIG